MKEGYPVLGFFIFSKKGNVAPESRLNDRSSMERYWKEQSLHVHEGMSHRPWGDGKNFSFRGGGE